MRMLLALSREAMRWAAAALHTLPRGSSRSRALGSPPGWGSPRSAILGASLSLAVTAAL